jgi:hypothetical protein
LIRLLEEDELIDLGGTKITGETRAKGRMEMRPKYQRYIAPPDL